MSPTMRIIPALALVLAAVACDRTPTEANSGARPVTPRMATNVSTVCTSASVPTGYVILSYGYSIYCGSSGIYPNSKTIGLPSSPETVCTSSSVPSGWVITSYGGYTSSCDPYSNSTGLPRVTMSIKIPGTSELVCNSSPIPSGYSIGTATWTSGCDRYNEGYRGYNNARQINKI